MMILPHSTVGAVAGSFAANSIAAFFIGWASHHLLDMIPHIDIGSYNIKIGEVLKNKKPLLIIVLDIIISITIFSIIMFYSDNKITVFFGTFGGLFPDLVDNSPFWSERIRKYQPFKAFHWFHENFHTTLTNPKYFIWGILTQLIIVVGSFLYYLISI